MNQQGAPDENRNVTHRVGLLLSVALLTLAGCAIPIVEPEPRPPTITNSLDDTADIFVVEDSGSRSFVVSIPSGESYEWKNPEEEWGCVGKNLVAVVGDHDAESNRPDEYTLCEDDVWVIDGRSET